MKRREEDQEESDRPSGKNNGDNSQSFAFALGTAKTSPGLVGGTASSGNSRFSAGFSSPSSSGASFSSPVLQQGLKLSSPVSSTLFSLPTSASAANGGTLGTEGNKSADPLSNLLPPKSSGASANSATAKIMELASEIQMLGITYVDEVRGHSTEICAKDDAIRADADMVTTFSA